MSLHDAPRFGRAAFDAPAELVASILREHASALNATRWMHCGYASLAPAGVTTPWINVAADVDNAFRLSPRYGFEQTPLIVTTGLRGSRFAPVVFWEALHALAPGGTWIDIDESSRCGGTALAGDIPSREYFASCLQPVSTRRHGQLLVQTFSKAVATPLASTMADDGWSFGILTAGDSPAAAQMARSILALDLPRIEVIVCGPRPSALPHDDRIRVVDLDAPEPRGWITHKKNLLAAAARYENLCLLHDRYVITPEWASALAGYGRCYAFVTFPQAYYADVTRRFPQRYPDYQLLRQAAGLTAARESHVYDADRVFHPAYDDFAETAFCCGGLYIAKRSLWNLAPQNESLFHCEWEDISFGLECQRRGLPHRVNPALTAESTNAHPLLLTRRHDLVADVPERRRLHVSTAQIEAAARTPQIFKPVLATTRGAYYESVRRRFNAIPGLTPDERLDADAVRDCRGLADFWRVVERHATRVATDSRDRIAAVAFFVCDTVYKFPNAQVLSWIRAHEAALARPDVLAPFTTIVGWGTGSVFASTHRLIGRHVAFAIDSDEARWGTAVDGVDVRPPAALNELSPTRTAVVVFSCFLDEIRHAVAALGPFVTFDAAEIAAARRFRPIADLVTHFEEIERCYPVLFAEPAARVAA